jgi:hypothetical protein
MYCTAGYYLISQRSKTATVRYVSRQIFENKVSPCFVIKHHICFFFIKRIKLMSHSDEKTARSRCKKNKAFSYHPRNFPDSSFIVLSAKFPKLVKWKQNFEVIKFFSTGRNLGGFFMQTIKGSISVGA